MEKLEKSPILTPTQMMSETDRNVGNRVQDGAALQGEKVRNSMRSMLCPAPLTPPSLNKATVQIPRRNLFQWALLRSKESKLARDSCCILTGIPPVPLASCEPASSHGHRALVQKTQSFMVILLHIHCRRARSPVCLFVFPEFLKRV